MSPDALAPVQFGTIRVINARDETQVSIRQT